MRDPDQALGRLEAPVEGVYLVAQPVEALEDGVELPVVEMLSVHVPDLSLGAALDNRSRKVEIGWNDGGS